MARRTTQNSLNVWLNGTPVGRWSITRHTSTFTYFEAWLEDELRRPLSLSMPFTAGNQPYSGDVVTNYFDNLLPDSEPIRRRLAQRYSTGSTGPFALLQAIGRDCVGAVQLLHPEETPDDLFSIQGELLDEHRVAEILRATTAPGGLGRDDHSGDLRLSIAGAQEKNALLWHDGNWYRPIGSTPTTHILKLPLGQVGNMRADMRTSVENEWLCAQIMAGFDLPVARTAIMQFEDQKVLGVERFDRKYSDDQSWIVRLPQEDMCQAMGLSPLHKYQADGGPGIDRIMQLLLGSETPEADRRNFFKAQIVFWLLVAPDGHAKNFSIMLSPHGRYRATPLYDVLSAHPILGHGANLISPHDVKLAMAVRGSTNYYLVNRIMRRHWTATARRVGLGARAAEQVIEEILTQAPAIAGRLRHSLPDGYPIDVADSILHGMLRQCDRLAQMPPG
ncbi:MAG: type II toxin-antitoxin system HipA family toxin [Burkholderiaceae bacterium]|nr:type II toxin-antitoxin system HipA family toxin [Burkholderiaceae bacterium]